MLFVRAVSFRTFWPNCHGNYEWNDKLVLNAFLYLNSGEDENFLLMGKSISGKNVLYPRKMLEEVKENFRHCYIGVGKQREINVC